MMLFRRQGLIPATRPQAALSIDQQHAEIRRGGFTDLKLHGLGGDARTGEAALDIQDVTVRFGGLTALNKVEIMVPKGSVVAVIGPNGSGKSTLFNVITGLVPAEEGSIRFHGEEIMGLPDYQILEKGIARTFQNLRLFANLTVMENALIGQHARLKTGTVAAILRPPGTQAEERQAREWAMEIFSHLRQPPDAARRAGGRRACPTPIAAASRSPARWRRGRASCCWTSRRRA